MKLHAWRYDADHSAGVKTKCGRVLYVPLEFSAETRVACEVCGAGTQEAR